jgi:hypothetical protein
MTNPVENKIKHAADSVEPSAEFSQALWNQMRMTPRNENQPKRVSRFVWIPALTVLGILVVMVFVAPQTVMAAVKGLLSYLPGVGFVEKDESTLYLEKPVVVEQGGFTFTLDQVVADKNKVSIAYHMVSQTSSFVHCAYNENFLVLPDDKSNNPIGGGVSSDAEGGITAQIDYFPLPKGATQASLRVAADPNEPGCAAPCEWIVPFTLGTEMPDAEFLPVVVSDATQTTSSPSQSPSSTSDGKVQLVVDQYVELADGYLLTGHIENQEPSWRQISTNANFMSAQDGNGSSVPLKSADVNLQDNEFAVIVATKDFAAPLTLHVNQLSVLASEEQEPTFTFDAGSDPQVDQSWAINQEIEIAGKTITVKEIKVIEDTSKINHPTSVMGYDISATSADNINVSFDCSGKEKSSSSWNQSMPGNGNDFTVENFYPDGIPNGVVTCKIWSAFFQASGDWQFTWQPTVQ